MIEEGDKVMVCVSGGKDSYAMLDILLKMQARAPVRFELIAVNLDQKQPGFPEHVLPQYLGELGVPFHIENQDTYSIVKRLIPEGKTLCSLCSRLRRGILYRVADELGATKIALGHHRDDILQTFFLNMFFGGKLKGMPPKLVSDDGRHIVIRRWPGGRERPGALGRHRQFPIIPCTCAAARTNLQRKQVAAMLQDWEKQASRPHREHVHALQNVVPSHLMDDLLRAWDTARAVSDAAGVALVLDEGLRERGFGVFEGQTFAEIEARWPQESQRWRQRDPHWAPEGGESLSQMRERVLATLARLAAAHRGEQIVLVAHGGVMDMLYREATGLGLQAPRTWQLGNAAVNRLLWTPDSLTLVGWSDTSHLDDDFLEETTA
jgi:tRNA 2-thiocytidine biosynthesis protein TtcA